LVAQTVKTTPSAVALGKQKPAAKLAAPAWLAHKAAARAAASAAGKQNGAAKRRQLDAGFTKGRRNRCL
jgi:hypothetical protein